MRFKKIFWLDFLIKCFLLIHPFIFYKNSLIAGPEVYSILNSKISLIKSLSVWDSSFGFGLYNNVAVLIYNIIYYLLNLFFDIHLVQNMVLGFTGLFAYIFYKKYLLLLKNYFNFEENQYFDTLAALLYIFNPFYMYMANWFPTYQIMFFLLALNSFYILKFLEKKEKKFYDYFKLLIISLISSYSGINIGLFLILLLVILLNIFLVFIKSVSKEKIKLAFIYLAIFLLTNLFWLVPFGLNIFLNTANTNLYSSEENVNLREKPIFDSLTLHSFIYSDKVDAFNKNYFDFSYWYKNFSQLVFLLLFFVTFYFALKRTKEDKKRSIFILYILFIVFFAIFFSKGMDEPIGDLFRFMITNVEYFAIFRSADIKIPFFFIFFFPILVSTIKANRTVFILFFTSIIFLGSPLIFGQTITSKYLISFPADSNNLKNIPSNKRLLLFPKTHDVLEFHEWGYQGAWLSTQFADFSSIGYLESAYGKSVYEQNFLLINQVYDELLKDNNYSQVNSLIEKFSITGILVRKNISLSKSYIYSQSINLNQCVNYIYENQRINTNLNTYLKNRGIKKSFETENYIYYDFGNTYFFKSTHFNLLENIANKIFIFSKKEECSNCRLKINQSFDEKWVLIPLSTDIKCVFTPIKATNDKISTTFNITDSCSKNYLLIYWPELVFYLLLTIIPLELILIYKKKYEK